MNDILVMLLSKFNNKEEIKMSTAKDEDGNVYNYYHQMEPVPQMLRKREQLNTIVALCTDQTFEGENLIINGEKGIISEVDYFKKQFDDVTINFVRINVENPAGGIIEATKIIRDLYEKGDCRLWVDIHGGFRSLQTTFQVVLSLLAKEGITSEKNYTVEGRGTEYQIKEEMQSFDINYLFAGMNEFFNTGKADMLARFIENRPANENNKELIRIINTISDSILLCDMDSFDDGCVEMAGWLANRENDGSYIDIFAEYFEADYGKLLDKKKSITTRIEWCKDKNYLQQALTIIESKMPEKIYNSFIICSNTDQTVSIETKNKKFTKKIKDLIDDTKPKWESRANYLVMKYAYEKILDKDDNGYAVFLDLNEDIKAIVKEAIEHPKFEGGLDVTFELEDKFKNKYNVVFEYKREESEEFLFKLFLQLHMTLKDQRNNAAHGASSQKHERVKAKNVKNAIEAYLELARALKIN